VPLSKLSEFISNDYLAAVVLQIAASLFAAGVTYCFIRCLLSIDSGRPIYLFLLAALIALMFATKETAPITVATMIMAAACVAIREEIAACARAKKNVSALAALATSLRA
ncbi:MAG: hypothetical protein C4325_03325, partial [Blastocatellia bacterium]